jgi:hypothetical protein
MEGMFARKPAAQPAKEMQLMARVTRKETGTPRKYRHTQDSSRPGIENDLLQSDPPGTLVLSQ